MMGLQDEQKELFSYSVGLGSGVCVGLGSALKS